jgi:hypothetical protein
MQLRWWLAKDTLQAQPEPHQISDWYEFVNQNFIYRGAWGIGSIIGLLLDTTEEGQPIRPLEIEDWPRSGLPWIAFWIKDLLTWGTLDPVAVFLLARGDAVNRPQAEAEARGYYDSLPDDIDPNDALDPRRIRGWFEIWRARPEEPIAIREIMLEATLVRPVADYRQPHVTVTPYEVDNSLIWIDPGGYVVARSKKPDDWLDKPSSFDFRLAVMEATIMGEAYLQHL